MDTTALWVTVKLATVTTVVLGLVGIPLAWWLCRLQSRARIFVEAALALPLVLPPTVLGFYALWMMGPNHVVGRAFETLLGEPLPFSFADLAQALPARTRVFCGRLRAQRGAEQRSARQRGE